MAETAKRDETRAMTLASALRRMEAASHPMMDSQETAMMEAREALTELERERQELETELLTTTQAMLDARRELELAAAREAMLENRLTVATRKVADQEGLLTELAAALSLARAKAETLEWELALAPDRCPWCKRRLD